MFGFPVVLDVTGRRCVVVGGGRAAGGKAEALRGAGANVVEVPPGEYDASVLDGAFVAISTGEDGTDPVRFFADAEERGVVVNTMDDIPRCHFAFPSIIERGDLRVAISTGGRAPALARRLRLHFEALLPEIVADVVDAVAEARDRSLPRTVGFPEWVARWREAVDDLDELIALAEDGRSDEIRDRVVATVTRQAS